VVASEARHPAPDEDAPVVEDGLCQLQRAVRRALHLANVGEAFQVDLAEGGGDRGQRRRSGPGVPVGGDDPKHKGGL